MNRSKNGELIGSVVMNTKKTFCAVAILNLAKFEYELMRADVKMRFFVSIQSQV